MTLISTLFYFILTIGILVLVHEFGHFLAAILCGMRAEVFAVGMGSRVFGWNKRTKFTFGKLPEDIDLEGNTDYRIALFPIGGYVKIAGMIDESLDTEFLKQEPQPWEFRSKPKWQRALVLSAGVLMNLLLAIIIFWGIIYHQGKTIRPVTEIGSVVLHSPAAKAGLLTGDKILSINGRPIDQWDEIESSLYTESVTHDLRLRIQRSDSIMNIVIRHSDVPDFTEERFGINPVGEVPLIIDVDKEKPAGLIGLQPGDTITGIEGVPVSAGKLPEVIRLHKGKEILLTWTRGDQKMSAHVTPNEEGRIGIQIASVYQGPFQRQEYGFFEALPAGIEELKFTSVLFLSNIYQLVIGKASLSKSVGGPVKIAQMAKRSADSGFLNFLGFVGLLSISLALLNILPFPALDGGHLLFLAIEAIIRREVPVKIKIAIQQAGFILLLVFMAFVLYNDVINF
jgi:regulator of sigma E protease